MVDSNATELGAAGADSARGRLKVFLGYASGVGKSFRMFDEARRRKERGQDVVVGALQPEVPPEIKSLLDFLEVAPSIDVEVFLLLTFQQSSAAIRKCASLTGWRMTAPGAMLIVWQDVDELHRRGAVRYHRRIDVAICAPSLRT
jgi:two-component system sensor histidine kinase KdpD